MARASDLQTMPLLSELVGRTTALVSVADLHGEGFNQQVI